MIAVCVILWASLLGSHRLMAQKIWVEPVDYQLSDTLTIFVDIKACRIQTLLGQDSVFFFPVIPYLEDEKKGTWASSNPEMAMTPEGEDVWSFELVPTEFYDLDSLSLAQYGWWFLLKAKDGLEGVNQEAQLATENLYLIRAPYNPLYLISANVDDIESPSQYLSYPLREYLMVLPDPGERRSIDEALGARDSGEFTFIDEMPNQDFLRQPFWLHTVVKNSLDLPMTHTLILGNWVKSWDRAKVFLVDSLGRVDTLLTGYEVPIGQKPIRDWRNLIPLNLGPGEEVEIYVQFIELASHELIPDQDLSLLSEIHFPYLLSKERDYHITFAFLGSVLGFIILFYLLWFFMTRKKEQVFYALLWTGFLLALLIPSPEGHFFAINHYFPLVQNLFNLSIAWLFVSSITLWGILGFSIHYLNIPYFYPKYLTYARVLALLPVVGFVLVIINYAFPHWFPYDPAGFKGFIYRPTTTIRSVLLGGSFIFSLIMGVKVHQLGFKPARYFLIAFLPLTAATSLLALSNIVREFQPDQGEQFEFGLAPGWEIVNNACMLLAMILFALAMGYKQKRLEEDHNHAQQQLLAAQEKSIEEQKKVNDRLRQMDQLKDQFLANTSHELRTPLNGIIGLSEALEEEEHDTGKQENLSMIISSARRLSSLVNDILDFSKLKNHEIELRRKPLDLKALVDVIIRIHQPLIEGKNLELVNEIPEDTPLIHADEDRMQQILFNLIGNAAKFTERGEIVVKAMADGDMVKASVSDTGIGIPENKRDAIFQAFEQGDGSIQREFAGTGLGLSISRKLIEEHGGAMWVDSVLGEGSTFYFTLPQASAAFSGPVSAQNTPVNNSQLEKEAASKSEPGKVTPVVKADPDTPIDSDQALRILVVDDEPINHQVIKNHLKSNEYRMTSALDGEEALSYIEGGQQFDLVLLDVMMPRMSGYEVCQRIRQQYLPSELPVIMVTAKNQVADLVQGLDIGANDYLAKPFTKDEFLARLKTHLNLHRINTVTNRFVPSEFIRSLGKATLTEVKLGDLVEKEVTVFFSDIRDYTSLAETMAPAENFRFVNAYAGRMGPIIQSHHGFVNQYLGDGIMAIFQHSPADALTAAIAMQHRLVNYNAERKNLSRMPIRVGMGLHTGPLVMGIIGDNRRTDAATISDTVNTASRMESLTKTVGAQILLSEQSVAGLQHTEQYHLRYLGKVFVKGKREPIGIYECYDGDPMPIQQLKAETSDQFDQGIALYLQQQFREAISEWEGVLDVNPDDRVAQYFCQQALHHLTHGAPEGWVG